MSKRSSGGCSECKRSRIKCDEKRPTCGTCARRGHICPGYVDSRPALQWQQVDPSSACHRQSSKRKSRDRTHATQRQAAATMAPEPEEGMETLDEEHAGIQPLVLLRQQHGRQYSHDLVLAASQGPDTTLACLPEGTISEADKLVINIYFTRHPPELVMNNEDEFIKEMNVNILLVLQQCPEIVSDTLFCIGQVYLQQSGSGSIVPALDRRGRMLGRLRAMAEVEEDLEQSIVLALGLTAMDLIDTNYLPAETVIPSLLTYTGRQISRNIAAGLRISPLAKYFIRALARQEIIVALTYRRRVSIPTDTWLDDECRRSADRFMGFTVTLMPLLEELCALAEDVRSSQAALDCGSPLTESAWGHGDGDDVLLTLAPSAFAMPQPPNSSFTARAADLRARIEAWRPMVAHTSFIRSYSKFLSHACAYRTAALLYLHRLLHPAGSSRPADEVALSMACEILGYLQAPPEEIRTSLWPATMCAAELGDARERGLVLEVFEAMWRSRRTSTARRAREFIVQRVWKERDAGREWDWMRLVDRWPEECIPI